MCLGSTPSLLWKMSMTKRGTWLSHDMSWKWVLVMPFQTWVGRLLSKLSFQTCVGKLLSKLSFQTWVGRLLSKLPQLIEIIRCTWMPLLTMLLRESYLWHSWRSTLVTAGPWRSIRCWNEFTSPSNNGAINANSLFDITFFTGLAVAQGWPGRLPRNWRTAMCWWGTRAAR